MISAQFAADFSSFKSAVDAADKQLADFAKGAGNVEKSLARMTDSLSGRKMIQEATLMARAITDLGGVSTLTAKQIEQLGPKAIEAAAKMKQLGLGVPAQLQAVVDQLKAATAAAETNAAMAKRLGASWSNAGSELKGVGTSLSVGITAPIVALGYTAIKASIDFESAFAGVRKTVTGTPAELQRLNAEFREMARVTPVSAVGLAKIGEMAGQLGVHKENIIAFTKTIVDISTATNLTADEAGSSFARLANVMKLPQDQFANLGSAVVALGNFGASTEQEMLSMAQRISAAGAAAGFTTPQVLGISNALSSVGIEAEAGGTAISRVITKMASDVASGGGHLRQFADTAQMSVQQFQKAFKADAGAAFSAFMEGLSHVKDKGESLFATMDELGFQEVRLKNAMLSAAGAGDLMKDSIALGTKAFAENSELTRAAGERYGTTANQLKILENKLTDVRIELGDALKPVLVDLMRAAVPLLEWAASAAKTFADLPEPLRLAAAGVAGLTALLGPAVFVMGSFVGAAGQLATAFGVLATAEAELGAAGALAGEGALLSFLSNPIVLGAALAIGGISAAVYELNKSLEEMEHHSQAGQVLEGLKDSAGHPMMNASAIQSMGLARSGNPAAGWLANGTSIHMDFKTMPGWETAAADVAISTNNKLLESVKALTSAQRARIDADKAAGLTIQQIAADTGIAADVIGVYERQTATAHKAAVAAESEHAKALKVLAQAHRDARNAAIPLDEIQKVMAKHYQGLGLNITETAVLIGAADIQVKVFTESLKELDKIRVIEAGRGPLLGPIAGQELVNIHQQLKDITAELTKIHNIEAGVPLSGPIKGELLYKPSMSDIPKGAVTIGGALSALSGNFTQLAQVSGGALSTIATGFAVATKAGEGMAGALEKISKIPPGSFTPQNISAIATDFVSAGIAIYDFTTKLIDAHRAAEALEKSLEFAKTIGKDFQAGQFSSSLAKEIEDLSTVLGALYGLPQREFGEALKLDDLVKELGGLGALDANQLKTVQDRIGDLFTIIAKGGRPAVLAIEQLDKVLADMGAHVDAFGRVSDFFADMVEKARAFGIALPEVDKFFRGQLANMVAGLDDLLTQPLITRSAAVGKAVKDAQDAVDKQKEAIDDSVRGSSAWKTATDELKKAQEQLTDALTMQHGEAERNNQALDDLGLIAFTTFNAAIASGQDFVTALRGIAPQVELIKKAYDDLGLSIDDAAVRGLILENTILNGPGGVGKAISGLQAVVTAAMNFGRGVETPDAFAAQQRQLASLYTQTQGATAAAGGSTINALLPFQQTLHVLDDWAKKNGLELDERTQQMIDQSRELGIWNDDFKSDSEKTRESIAELVKSNYDLAVALGGTADAVRNAPGGRAPSSGFLAGDDPTGGLIYPPTPIPMASGGVGFARRPMLFSTQGNEEYAFSGEGQRFLRGDERASLRQPPIIIAPHFNISSVKPDTLAELVEHEIAPQLIGLIEDHVRDYNERMTAALATRRRS